MNFGGEQWAAENDETLLFTKVKQAVPVKQFQHCPIHLNMQIKYTETLAYTTAPPKNKPIVQVTLILSSQLTQCFVTSRVTQNSY